MRLCDSFVGSIFLTNIFDSHASFLVAVVEIDLNCCVTLYDTVYFRLLMNVKDNFRPTSNFAASCSVVLVCWPFLPGSSDWIL